MPLTAMACGPTGLECMKGQWASHSGHDLGMVGIGADFVGPPEPITMGPPLPGQVVVAPGSPGAQVAAAIAAARKKAPKDKPKDGDGGASALDWFNAITKSTKELVPVFKKQKPVAGGGGGGGGPEPTPWGTYAMIGGGVLIAGVATFAIIKAARKKKGK